MKIREFRFSEDYFQVGSLWASIEKGVNLGRSDTPEEIRKKVAHNPDLFLIAEENGQIIGTVIGGFDGRRGLVYHLAVDASIRGQGIGSRLMDELESSLRAKGRIRSYLLVTRDNDEAMRFYEKRGWEHMDWVVPYGKNLV